MVREKLRQAHDDCAADSGADLHLDAVYRSQQRAPGDGRLLGHLRATGEGDDPDFDVSGYFKQEGPGGLLRGLHARRLHIPHAHAEGDVHRQHDRRPRPGQRDMGAGSRQGKQQNEDGRQQQRRRHMPPPCAPCGLTGHAQAAQAQRRLGPPTQQPQVQRRQHGKHQQQPQVLRPQVGHLLRLHPNAEHHADRAACGRR